MTRVTLYRNPIRHPRRVRVLPVASVVVTVLMAPAGAQAEVPVRPRPVTSSWLAPPVQAVVARGFDRPEHDYGSGHRGIDYHVPEGTLVRAAAAGRVTFAGDVGATRAVTIAHRDGLETTYSSLGELLVAEGAIVRAGTYVGRSDVAHPGAPGLHFGVKLEGAYVDPESFFGPASIARAIRLAPLTWKPPAALGEAFAAAFRTSGFAQACDQAQPRAGFERAPNDNVAVAVAGIGSRTQPDTHAAMYEKGPELLGYRPERIYRFSYKGQSGDELHDPYEATDTWGDIRLSADRLRHLLEEVARRHPGVAIDLIAHSQGGIVARTFLASADAWDARLPQIEHLVTFATPHDGAPLADLVEELPSQTVSGRALVGATSRWAQRGGPIPDPLSPAVEQLRPGSELLDELAAQGHVHGTRALALGIPNDVVVPAHRAGLPDGLSRAVPPAGVNGHDAITGSPDALALAHAFLRDAPDACRGGWDLWGPRAGRVVEAAERKIPEVVARVEREVAKRVLRAILP